MLKKIHFLLVTNFSTDSGSPGLYIFKTGLLHILKEKLKHQQNVQFFFKYFQAVGKIAAADASEKLETIDKNDTTKSETELDKQKDDSSASENGE